MSLLAKWHETLLEALAHRADHAFVQTDFDGLQVHELRNAQTARIHELEHGAVAHAERGFDIGRLEQRLDLGFAQCRGHAHGLLGREQAKRRIHGHEMLAQGPRKEAPEHGQPSIRRTRLVAAAHPGIRNQVLAARRGKRMRVAAREPIGKQTQIAPIRIERVARQTLLEPQRVAERIDRAQAFGMRGGKWRLLIDAHIGLPSPASR